MADINSPMHRSNAMVMSSNDVVAEDAEQAFCIRESISSPNIMSGKSQH